MPINLALKAIRNPRKAARRLLELAGSRPHTRESPARESTEVPSRKTELPTNNFIVCAHGWSGSRWLAHVLHKHPDILCTHSAWNRLADSSVFDDKDMHGFARQRKQGWGARDQCTDDTLRAIHQHGSASAYGCVHTYRLHDFLDRLPSPDKAEVPFRLANLVRHPVDLVLSGMGEFRALYDFDVVILYRNVARIFRRLESFYWDFAEKHDLNLADLDTIAFCNAARAPYNLRKDLDTHAALDRDVAWFRMEDLTGDRSYFADAASTLTSGRIEITDDYLHQVFDTGAVNRHRSDGRPATTAEKYARLAHWQRELLDLTITDSGIRPAYERMGYDFSFMDRPDVVQGQSE